MKASPEYASLARLVESLRPWLPQIVVVGGWAHRLHRLHPLAQQLPYEPLATLDADIALPAGFKVSGDEIYQRLVSNGFEAEFLGHHKPPAAHYRLNEPGVEFYAEFVAPLAGSAVSRDGRSKATQRVGGISSQILRYVEILLAKPWSVALFAHNDFPLGHEARVQIANPVCFLAQKILIHGRRNRQDRAKDILYMHDTIETFAGRIDELSAEWATNIRPLVHVNSARTIRRAAASLFGEVTDPIRSASRIVQGRTLPPEAIRETCSLGFTRVFGGRKSEK
jgi:hypothetical protein